MATTLTPTERLIAVKEHAVSAWYEFASERNHKVIVPSWREGTAPDGNPRLTCEVVGPGAAHVLHLFASEGPLVFKLGTGGDTKPTYDYQDGRTAVVWRRQGVWVELWVPDSQSAVPKPSAMPSRPATLTRRRLIRRPSGRLPFGRRPNTVKDSQ